VELRVFEGLTREERIGCRPATVARHWNFALAGKGTLKRTIKFLPHRQNAGRSRPV